MTIPLQFCDFNRGIVGINKVLNGLCEARGRIGQPLMGEALRRGILRKIGEGRHAKFI